MPQEDAATGQFEKAQEILGVVLVASNQATKVVKPSEQAFDFPSSPIPSQRASVLGGVFAVAPMGSDQFDTLLLQLLIQRIGVVRPIPDQALRLFREEVLRERFFDELRFLRRSTGNANGDRKTMAVGHGHAEWDRQRSPLLRAAEAGIDEGLRDIQASSGSQVFGQHFQDAGQDSMVHPALKTPMAGWVGRIALGKVLPGGSCAPTAPHSALDDCLAKVSHGHPACASLSAAAPAAPLGRR